MSQLDDYDAKPWTSDDLKEALRRIKAGEINFKEAEVCYGISPRTIHRQRAIENMRAQLNPEKGKKLKHAVSSVTKKDVPLLLKSVDISCNSLSEVVSLLDSGTEEVKQVLKYECDIIYECKVCKNLFRSLVNFISHKRMYCCDAYCVNHSRTNEKDDGSKSNDPIKGDEKGRTKDNAKEVITKPIRMTCRKDLTLILKKIATSELMADEPVLQLQNMENTPYAFKQIVNSGSSSKLIQSPQSNGESSSNDACSEVEVIKKEAATTTAIRSEPPIVSGKIFGCPLCNSFFTIRRSVIRHLRIVHHKSDNEVEKLKGQISNKESSANQSPTTEKVAISSHKLIDSANPGSEQRKETESKSCASCNRHFTSRSVYATHVKGCRKQSQPETDVESTDGNVKPPTLIPFISLSPIASVSDFLKTEAIKKDIVAIEDSKKIGSVSPAVKKICFPLPESSPSSKKIGIQVRVDYHKDNTVQPSLTNGGTTVGTSAVSQSSSDHSRRNSLIECKAPESESKVIKEPSARSSDKADITESRLTENDNSEDSSKVKLEEREVRGNEREALRNNEASIYCEDCKTTFSLTDYKCNFGNEGVRNFRCALRNCDFRCDDNEHLLPHMREKHPVLPEAELAEVKSFFIAESTSQINTKNKFCCQRNVAVVESFGKRKNPEKKSCSTKTSGVKVCKNPAAAKRKLTANSNKQVPTKRKSNAGTVREKSITKKLSEANENKAKNALLSNSAALTNRTSAIDPPPVPKMAGKKTVSLPRSQNLKKATCKSVENIRKKLSEPFIGFPVVNGVVSSSSEEENETDFDKTVSKLSQNAMSRKQNLLSPAKNSSHRNDLPGSVSPEFDSDATLKIKEVMQIIFGKDVPADKIRGNVGNIRNESSPSSSTSSENGKEKRCSTRLAKQTVTSKYVPSIDKEEKVSELLSLNKINSSR